MNITKNFSWEEMSFSETAHRRGIDNTIPEAYRGNMERLCKEVLQPVRDAWGAPIVVSSGYRCMALNKAVGGVSTSQHLYGSAADIHTTANTLADNGRLWDVVMKLQKEGKIHCRQIIWEYGRRSATGGNTPSPDGGPRWLHLSINDIYHSHQDNKIIYVGV